MFGETYDMSHVYQLIDAAKKGRRCLEYFIKKYPNDPEITAAKIDLRSINKSLKGWE